MKNSVIHWIVLLISLAGCCTHWINFNSFSELTLVEQISEFERGIREHCIRRPGKGILIVDMANHGIDSVTAMTALLKYPVRDFPPEDAIDVLESVYAAGIDIRQHECAALLSNLANTASDRIVRERAQDALWRMRTYAPGELQRPWKGPPTP
jgi:hypothetical protein